MTDTGPTSAAEPDGAQDAAGRLPLLDVLRGVAILAILFMDIEAMGGPFNGLLLGDPRLLGWTGADRAAWWVKDVLGEGTARCLLEMLFGAGMVILIDRADTRLDEARVLRAYAWRNIVLLLFGLLHVFVLLWPGDILHTYALAALVAMGFRLLRPRLLLVIGLAMATAQLVGGGTGAITAATERQAAAALHARQTAGAALTPTEHRKLADFDHRQAERAAERKQAAAAVAAENKARAGNAASWMRSLWAVFLKVEAMGMEPLLVWEAASTMLIGAGLFKLGVLQGERSRRFYLRLALTGYGVGLPLRIWGAYHLTRFDGSPSFAFPFGEWARLLVTLGHVGLIAAMMTSAAGARWLRPFAAAGRTALTLYILQTLVTMWLLYPPWGLRLYGQQGWAALMLTAFTINALLLALANWWVRRFAIAPVEWAWRSMVAGRALPMRKA